MSEKRYCNCNPDPAKAAERLARFRKLAAREMSWDTNTATSHSPSRGLMQMIPTTFGEADE